MTVFPVICRLHRGRQSTLGTANMRGSWAADHGPQPAARSLLTPTPLEQDQKVIAKQYQQPLFRGLFTSEAEIGMVF